jgi:hypothetical protein
MRIVCAMRRSQFIICQKRRKPRRGLVRGVARRERNDFGLVRLLVRQNFSPEIAR